MINKRKLITSLITYFFILYFNIGYSQNTCESIEEYRALRTILGETENKGESINNKIESFKIVNENINQYERELIISLLRCFSYKKFNSIKDEILAKEHLNKIKRFAKNNINENNCLNIVVLELELLGLSLENQLSKYNEIIRLCKINNINPSSYYRLKGLTYHRLKRKGGKDLENAKEWYEKAIDIANGDMEVLTKSSQH